MVHFGLLQWTHVSISEIEYSSPLPRMQIDAQMDLVFFLLDTPSKIGWKARTVFTGKRLCRDAIKV